jgi:hypothetical protein
MIVFRLVPTAFRLDELLRRWLRGPNDPHRAPCRRNDAQPAARVDAEPFCFEHIRREYEVFAHAEAMSLDRGTSRARRAGR